MFKIYSKIALVAFIVSICSSNIVNAYAMYAAVYYNPKTNKTVRVMGDHHGEYFTSGTYYDKKSHEIIKNALKNGKFEPFWIVETGHKMKKFPWISSDDSLIDQMTHQNCLLRKTYKKNNTIVKNKPNLFSDKDFVMPNSGDFQSISPSVIDLRHPIIDFVHFCFSEKFYSPYNFRDRLNQKKSTIKLNLFDVSNIILKDAGNQLLATEFVLKKTNNYTSLKVLKDLYNALKEKTLLHKDSILTRFLEYSHLNGYELIEVQNKLKDFFQGIVCDLPDFGFFAQILRFSAFTNNVILYAGNIHIKNIEILLQKVGFERIWQEKAYTKIPGRMLSQEDCEKFFSIQPEKKVETKVEEEFFVKSKL